MGSVVSVRPSLNTLRLAIREAAKSGIPDHATYCPTLSYPGFVPLNAELLLLCPHDLQAHYINLPPQSRQTKSSPPNAFSLRGPKRPKMPLSDEQKWQIISTWKTTGSIRETAKRTGISRISVRLWIKRYTDTGSVRAETRRARQSLVDGPAAQLAVQLLLSDDCGSASAAAVELHNAGITPRVLHKSTITRAVKVHGKQGGKVITHVRGKPRKELSAANKAKRLAFAKANKRRSWKNVMFTDRKKFYFRYPGSRVKPSQWVEKGATRTAATVNHPLGLNVYAGITVHGVTQAHIVAGTSKHKTQYNNKNGAEAKNITAQEYADVVKSTFLRDGARLFSTHGVSSWILQQDNDPTHRAASAVVSEHNRRNASSISILGDWPPNSPDLNPIENLWAWVEAKVNALGCQTFEQFSQAVLDQLAAVPKAMLVKLINSMPKRLEKVIELEGDRTKY